MTTSNPKKWAILMTGDPHQNLGNCCQRDVINMYRYLIGEAGFDEEKIYVLAQLNQYIFANTSQQTKLLDMNRGNLFEIFNQVVQQISADSVGGDNQPSKQFLFIHYSGHGFQTIDRDGDEVDGMDELICTNNGSVSDDEIFDRLVKPLPSTCTLFSLWDCCHAGGMDLPFVFDSDGRKKVATKRVDKIINCTAWSLSGCSENQCSQQQIGETIGFGGSLTISWFDLKLYEWLNNPVKMLKPLEQFLKPLGQKPLLHSSH